MITKTLHILKCIQHVDVCAAMSEITLINSFPDKIRCVARQKLSKLHSSI